MPETAQKPLKRAVGAAKASRVGVGITAAQKAVKTPKKNGRPNKYNVDIAQRICEHLSEGVPLREICRGQGMPAWRTVYDWMGRDPELSAAIARARDIGYDALAEECLQIADTIELGQKQVMTAEGTATTVEDMLGHRKLQIETRLKLLAKFHPSKYGDRVGLHGVEDAPAIKTEDIGSSKLFDLIRNLEMKTRLS